MDMPKGWTLAETVEMNLPDNTVISQLQEYLHESKIIKTQTGIQALYIDKQTDLSRFQLHSAADQDVLSEALMIVFNQNDHHELMLEALIQCACLIAFTDNASALNEKEYLSIGIVELEIADDTISFPVFRRQQAIETMLREQAPKKQVSQGEDALKRGLGNSGQNDTGDGPSTDHLKGREEWFRKRQQ